MDVILVIVVIAGHGATGIVTLRLVVFAHDLVRKVCHLSGSGACSNRLVESLEHAGEGGYQKPPHPAAAAFSILAAQVMTAQ
jgi:hypothetical protein